MAKADKHSMGAGAQGKGSGSGAMTDLPDDTLEENAVLSNRDKSRHTEARGLDSKTVQTEQYQDHAANRTGDEAASGDGSTSGQTSPSMGGSGDDSSLKSQRRG